MFIIAMILVIFGIFLIAKCQRNVGMAGIGFFLVIIGLGLIGM